MKRLKSDAGSSGTTPVQSPRAGAPATQPPSAGHPPPMASTAPSRLPERGQPATTPQQTLPTIPELHEEGAAGEHCHWPAARPAAAPPVRPAAESAAGGPVPVQPAHSASAAPRWSAHSGGKQQRQRRQQKQQQAEQPPELELKSAPASEDEAQASTAASGAPDCERGAACRRRRLGGSSAGFQLIPSPLPSAIPAAALTLPPGSPLAHSPHQALPLLQLGSPAGQSPQGWALVPWRPPSPLSPLPPLPNGATSRQHAAGWHLEQASPRQALAGGRKRLAEDKGEEQAAAAAAPDDATAMSTDEPHSVLTTAGLPRQLSDVLHEALNPQQAQQAQRAQQPQPHHETVAAVAAAAAAAAVAAAMAPAALSHAAAALSAAAPRALPASSVSCCCESMEE